MSLEFALLDASGEADPAADNFEEAVPVPLSAFDVRQGALPAEGVFDAVIVSGSPASVYWDLDWLEPLRAWVDGAIDRGTPILGVCFGFQLLADVLGGEVDGRDAYELGFHPIEHAGDTHLFEGIDREFIAFTSHSDDVVSIPLGARRLAENDYSAHAFRRQHVFGVQFHPEVDWDTAARLVEDRDHSQERCPDAAATLTEDNYASARQARRVFENFADYVRDRPAT